VLGQRFERRSKADPFDVYRALRDRCDGIDVYFDNVGGPILDAALGCGRCERQRQRGDGDALLQRRY